MSTKSRATHRETAPTEAPRGSDPTPTQPSRYCPVMPQSGGGTLRLQRPPQHQAGDHGEHGEQNKPGAAEHTGNREHERRDREEPEAAAREDEAVRALLAPTTGGPGGAPAFEIAHGLIIGAAPRAPAAPRTRCAGSGGTCRPGVRGRAA